MQERQILLSGASGATGGNILRSSVFMHDKFLCLKHKNPIIPHFAKASENPFDPSIIERLSPKLQYALHTAAVVPKKAQHDGDFDRNREIASNFALICNKANVDWCCMISTGSVFGNKVPPKGFSEEDEPDPTDAYGNSMLQAESAFAESLRNRDHLIIRLFYPYGFDSFTEQNNFIAKIFQRVQNREEITIAEDSDSHLFRPIFMPDLSVLLDRFMSDRLCGLINIAGPEAVNLSGMIAMMGEILGVNPDILKVKGIGSPAMCDISRLESVANMNELHYLKQGLEKTAKILFD